MPGTTKIDEACHFLFMLVKILTFLSDVQSGDRRLSETDLAGRMRV